jgi:hypothetical protein
MTNDTCNTRAFFAIILLVHGEDAYMLRLVSTFLAFCFFFGIFMTGYVLLSGGTNTFSAWEFVFGEIILFFLWRGTALWAAVRERRAMREKMMNGLHDKKFNH